MSDDWGPGDTGPEGGFPPPPPPSPVEPVLTLESEGEVTRSSGIGGRALAGVVGLVLLVGGTVFAVTQLGSSGPDSPEEAVSDLLDAASDEDVLGLLAALDPGERDTLRQPVEDLFAELERLEVVDPSFALDGIAGIDIEFADVTFRTEPVRDDLVRVYLTGGTVTGSFDADELPIGDFVSDTLERFDADISGVSESETSDLTEDDDTFLVARKGDDGWRVSIAYTAAEAARSEAGLALPAAGIEPIGSDSPEAAVDGLFRAAADLDLRGAIARLSPGELGALQDYAGLFIDDAEAGLRTAGDTFDLTIDDLSLRADGSGDRASVFIDSFALTIEAEGERVSVATDGECFTLDGDLDAFDLEGTPFADGPVCADDLEELSQEFFGQFGFGGPGSDLGTLPSLPDPTLGITTVRIDGGWYVAPVATGLDGVVAVLEVFDREALDAIVDLVERFVTGFEESFSEIGTSLDDFEDLEGFEQFEDLDVLEPGTPDEGAFGQGGIDDAGLENLERFVQEFAGGDRAFADCLLGNLLALDEATWYELADAYEFGYEPSQETQQVFFDAVEVCRPSTG